MEIAALAAAQIAAQSSLVQTEVGISMIRKHQDFQQQMVAMLAEAAPPPPEGTGVLLNVQA